MSCFQSIWLLVFDVQVFDDKNQFAEWFGDSFGKNAPGSEDDVAMEKRVVVIHRLHQILEPFMLRRQVQDVEGKLPPKVPSFAHVAFCSGHHCTTMAQGPPFFGWRRERGVPTFSHCMALIFIEPL